MDPKILIASLLMIFIGVGIMIYYGSRPSKVELNSKLVEIKGMYGLKIPQTEIVGITIINHLPKVDWKTNGFNYGNILKGNFRLKGIGAAKLFVYRDQPPYILIITRRTKLFINFKDRQQTRKLFRRLRENQS